MKTVVLCLTVLGLTQAVPAGVYHQEYNYKTSAASYRNNELQHKTDDEGYYSKDGDLEGRVKPKVHANSEHSEYINPKLQDYNTGFYGGANGDTSSYGHLRAENTYGVGSVGSAGYAGASGYGGQSHYGSGQYQSEGLASSDHISGAYGGYGSSSQNSYGSVTSASSNLRHITSRLEQELQRELQNAIYRNSYYSQSDLENELRRNLSQRIQDELTTQFGQQSIREGKSYTIAGGRIQSTPNYQQQELESLKRQVEDHLLNTLRTEYSRRSSSVSTGQHNVYDQNYIHQTTTTYRPYTSYPVVGNRPYIPSRGQIGQQPVDVETRPVYHPDSQPIYNAGGYSNAGGQSSSHSYGQESSSYQRVSNVRYTPVQNPESITTIASSVQHQMDEQLNRLLDQAQRQYFSQDTRYSLQSLDSILERLRDELRSNITYHLDEAIRRQYGNQIQRDGYMYTLGPNGQFSDSQNYRIADLESLRRQVETNLIEKLNRDFQNYRTRYQSQTKQAYVQENNHGYNEYTTIRTIPFHHGVSTPLYDQTYYQPGRPTSPSIVPVIGAGVKGGHYNSYEAGASHGGYEVSSSGNIAELQRQLQTDLSRQLQAALNKQHYTSQAYSQSGHSVPSYDVSYQRLYDELNRNLTRQFEEFQAGGSYGTYGSSGRGFNEAQLASLRSQLQQNLAGQLQQGLRQSYSSSSSYSASSSSSSGASSGYRQARGSEYNAGLGAYGQYRSGGAYAVQGQGEDCLDDPNTYHDNYRTKRSYGTDGYGYRSRPLGLSSHAGTGSSYGGSGSVSLGRNQPQVPQFEDDSDLTQQVEDQDFGHTSDHNQDLTQQIEHQDFGHNQDLTQQVEDQDVGQTVDDTRDLTQQVEHDDLTQQSQDLGQEFDNQDLTQQVEEEPIGNLQLGGQVQTDLGQHVNAGQQVEGTHTGKLSDSYKPSRSYSGGQQHVDEDVAIGRLEFGQQRPHTDSHQAESQYGQKPIHATSDVTQQEETENPAAPSGHRQAGYNSHSSVYNRDRTRHYKHDQDQVDLNTQQGVSDNQHEDDLTQQVEEDDFGKFHIGSQVNSNKLEADDQKRHTQIPSFSQNSNDDLLDQQLDNISEKLEGDVRKPSAPFLGQEEERNPSASGSNLDVPRVTTTSKPYVSEPDNLYTSTAFLNLQTPTQTKLKQKLEQTLRKQLQQALNAEYDGGNVGTHSYQQLSVELCNNITKEIERNMIEDYTFRSSYDQFQVRKLQSQLEYELKKELKQNLDTYSQQHYGQPGNSGETLTQQQEDEFTGPQNPQHHAPGESLNNNGATNGNVRPYDYPQRPWQRQSSFGYSRPDHRRPWQRQNSFLDRERNQNNDYPGYTEYRPYNPPTNYSPTTNQFNQEPLPGTPQQPLPGIAQTPLPGSLQKPQEPLLGTPQEPLPGTPQQPLPGTPQQPLPGTHQEPLPGTRQEHLHGISDELIYQQVPEPQDGLTQQQEDGLTQQQEDLSPYHPAVGQPNVNIEGQTQEDDLVQPALRPQRPTSNQNGYGYTGHHPHFHHHRTGWNAVPPKYIPYSERPTRPNTFATGNSNLTPGQSPDTIVPSDSFRPAAEYQYPPSHYPQGGVPSYQEPKPYPPQTQFQIGQPGYIPTAQQPNPVFQEQFLPSNQIPDLQNPIGQSQSQFQIGHPGYVPSVEPPRPVFQAQFVAPNQIEDEQKPVSPFTDAQPNVNPSEGQTQFQTGQPRPKPVFQGQYPLANQIDDEQKPLPPLDNGPSNVDPLQEPSQSPTSPVTQNQPSLNTPHPQTGFGFTSNGNVYTHQQTLSEAQRQSDLLIQQIRQTQRRRYQQTGRGSEGTVQAGLGGQVAHQPGMSGQQPDTGFGNGQETVPEDQFSQKPESDDLTGQQLAGGGLDIAVQNENKFEQQLNDDLKKQLLTAIDVDCANIVGNEKPTRRFYRYMYDKLHRDIQNNVTEILTAASEPGQSKYSQLIPSNVDERQAYVKSLQNQLVSQLCKTLEKELEIKFIDLEKEYYNKKYPRRNYPQYGLQENLNQNTETASEIQPFQPQPQHASEVQPVQLQFTPPGAQHTPPQTYNHNVGVKGHYRRPAVNTLQVEEKPFVNGENNGNGNLGAGVEVENGGPSTNIEQVELLSTTTEQPSSWWKRFGNKVKDGASKLKEKIVGPASTE